MEGARLRWRWTITAALLGFLTLTLLIPGTSALQCHSYTTIKPVSGNNINVEFSMAPSIFSNCSTDQTACVEAHLMLSTEKMGMLATYRGCANEGLKEKAESANSSNQHLTIHSRVRYCHSDFCNQQLPDLNVFKMPGHDKAPEASSSIQCYSGFMLDPDHDILDRVTCGRDDTKCYHGNGTITAGHLSVDFDIKTCQHPSCNVPESQSFGPIQLKLWGSCCRGIFCNGKMAAPQNKNISQTAPTQNTTTTHEEDTEYDIVNDTQNASPVPADVTVTPGNEWDTKTTAFPQNPLYDDEENEDAYHEFPSGTNGSLNPRTWNLGPPKPTLPFYLLVGPLGIAILGIW